MPHAPPPAGRRRAVRLATDDLIEVAPLLPGQPYPVVVRPRVDGLDLAQWGAQHSDLVQHLFERHRSLLFRGFTVASGDGPGSFGAFVDAVSEGPRLPYLDRTTPRKSYGSNLYCTTVFPADQHMPQHNEGSYWRQWSLKAFMACMVPAATGGETPIADVHGVHERIDPAVRAEFARRQWQLVRNYNDGFGLPWQEVFQTEDRAEVERFCAANRIEVEWKADGRLRTCQTRPAVRHHPRTGEPLWFNHAAFYHISSRAPAVRDALLDEFGEAGLPFATYFGDGSPIDPAAIAEINAAYAAEELCWPWQQGDVHLFDNMRLSHGRRPYTGDRLVLVALTEAHGDP